LRVAPFVLHARRREKEKRKNKAKEGGRRVCGSGWLSAGFAESAFAIEQGVFFENDSIEMQELLKQ
jgi:hypothetical protein